MNTQTISRKNLKAIYDSNICGAWKERIEKVLSDQPFADIIIVDNIDVNQGYSEANIKQKKIIEKYFKIIVPKEISDSISNFKDILKLCGVKLGNIIPWRCPVNKDQLSQNALAKIQCISRAYNENTILDWDNVNQYKYYPYFRKITGVWVLGEVFFAGGGAGGPAGAYYTSESNCRDAVSKFMDIYLDYLP